jgi:acyl-CoA synthetase (AMP-forming)/AMP-acid ligase II
MNFARFSTLNAKKYPTREFIIESHPSKNLRRSITWQVYEETTNKIANFLMKECGVKPGDSVLHLMMNSIEWHVAYMAALKAGAVITPLNFRFESNDIKFAGEVTKPKVFIFDEGFIPRIEPIMKEMDYCKYYVCLGEHTPQNTISYQELAEKGDPTEVLIDRADDDMAELLFTSGTTGAPKPVCHTHNSLFYIAIGNALTYNEGYDSIYLTPHPFYHTGSLFLSFPCFVAAGKIMMPMELKPTSFIRSLAEEKCTGGWTTVPTWSDLLTAIEHKEIDINDYDLSNLRHIEIGAQPVPFIILEKSKQIFPKVKLGNIYGISEGGGGGTINLYDEDILRKPGSIGKATAFMEAKAVDEEGRDVPPYKIGELVLKGPRIMKEYAFNPEMTAKTIRNGWLHTGDLIYMDEECYIYFAERAKDLIIRGGENIFPVEIEDALRKHPKVQDVAVIGYPHPRLVEIAMAVIQLKPNQTMTEEEVIELCKQVGLAKYKWPEKIVFDVVPRNPSGKIEKPKLREKYIKPEDKK